jgi:uncharacterized NAD-dependent epimerase/dehydratase family protein
VRRHRRQHRGARPAAARKLLEDTSAKYDLPCVDPIRTGVAAIVDELVRRFH